MPETLNGAVEISRGTSIRMKSLRRAKIIVSHLNSRENLTDYVSNAVDDKNRVLVAEHGIVLPADLQFSQEKS